MPYGEMLTIGAWWTAVALILYCYVGFPLVVLIRGIILRRPIRRDDITPAVSLIIAAHNEANVMRARLDNIGLLDYPPHLLETIVASDGSDDATESIVRAYCHRGIKLLVLPRQGKCGALNEAVAGCSGEILVFSDANTMFAPGAIRALVRPFADAAIGGVAGDQRYAWRSQFLAHGERAYWSFDRVMKSLQNRAGNATSATGAIYAIRGALFRPLPPGCADDFVISTRVVAQGYRLVFAGDAIAYESVAPSHRTEFRRKVRVVTQGLASVWLMRELLDPFRHGFYALQMFSHKVLRRMMVFPLGTMLALTPVVWEKGPVYAGLGLIQLITYSLALVGLLLSATRLGQMKVVSVPFYFCMVNLASLVGLVNLCVGRRVDRWAPERMAHVQEVSGDPVPADSVSQSS